MEDYGKADLSIFLNENVKPEKKLYLWETDKYLDEEAELYRKRK